MKVLLKEEHLRTTANYYHFTNIVEITKNKDFFKNTLMVM